jgi:UDP-N-acetylenolpyruvoylglucosamine reductase
MTNWIDNLNSIDGIIAKSNQPLHHHLPLRVGGNVDCWVRCSSRKALLEALPIIRRHSWRLHWPFQDWLVKDGGIKGCILRLEGEFEKIVSGEGFIELGTAALWSQTTNLGNSAVELQLWPGSVGSVLYGSDIKHLKGFNLEVEWVRGRSFETVTIAANQNFEIPKTVVPTKIKIIGKRKRRNRKPLGTGFAFIVDKKKLPGELLRDLRLNTVRLRNWKVSPFNPNQIVHIGYKEFEDVTLLQKALNQRISQIRKGSLQFRLPIIGRKKK